MYSISISDKQLYDEGFFSLAGSVKAYKSKDPRVPKERRRMLRAALSNAQRGVSVEGGFALEQLIGHSAFVYSAHPELGRDLLDAISSLLGTSES